MMMDMANAGIDPLIEFLIITGIIVWSAMLAVAFIALILFLSKIKVHLCRCVRFTNLYFERARIFEAEQSILSKIFFWIELTVTNFFDPPTSMTRVLKDGITVRVYWSEVSA